MTSPTAHGSANEASLFQTHLLALLSSISAAPSPSFPFPDAQDPPLPAYNGHKTAVEEALERGVLAIGERLKLAERNPMAQASFGQQQQHASASNSKQQPQSQLLTPDWTPPVEAATKPGAVPHGAFAAAAGISGDASCPTCHRSAVTTPTQQHPSSILKNISTSPQTPTNVIQDPFPALVSGNWAGDTGMSAEKELELLKAQVQDIARVCKVSNQGGKWQRFTLRLTL
jgi:osomolarity two-component system sensor histidine kinase NIK1